MLFNGFISHDGIKAIVLGDREVKGPCGARPRRQAFPTQLRPRLTEIREVEPPELVGRRVEG